MAYVSALFVPRMVDHAHPSLDRDALFKIAGVSREDAVIPGAKVPEENYYAMLEAIAAGDGDEIRFFLGVCASMKCEDFGVMGLAWRAAPTLRRSFYRTDRYIRSINAASVFALVDKGDTVWWTHRRTAPDRLGMLLSNEGALATFMTMCRQAAGPDFAPQLVQFCHQPTGSTHALEAHFGCEVRYGAETDAMIIHASVIDRPNIIGDEQVWRFFTEHLDQTLEELPSDESLGRRVIEKVAEVLSDGAPGIGDIAAEMGMGARTLQRRLADEGRQFQELVDEARRQLAEKLLADKRYSIAEIAFMTGFSEQSAFTRAFKRWAGKTPGAYRVAEMSA